MKSGEAAAIEAIASLFTARTGVEIRSNRHELVKGRLANRLRRLRLKSYEEYAEHLSSNFQTEIVHVVAQLTTHRTEFFREVEQIDHFIKHVAEPLIAAGKRIRVWSAATSTGEEAYTLAIAICEALVRRGIEPNKYLPGFEILASDVDQKSLAHARNGVYTQRVVQASGVARLSSWLQKGSGDLAEFYRVKDDIHRHCSFKMHNLLADGPPGKDFDAVFCRNVFIYFTKRNIERALQGLMDSLRPGALLYLGCTEPLESVPGRLENIFQSTYRLKKLGNESTGAEILPQSGIVCTEAKQVHKGPTSGRIRVLIVDDSRTVRMALRQALERTGRFEIVADVEGTKAARKILESQRVDVVTLDINMPEESGIAYLESVNAAGAMATHPPVVVVSSMNPDDADVFLRCEQLGATAYIEKPVNLGSAPVAAVLAETLAVACGRQVQNAQSSGTGSGQKGDAARTLIDSDAGKSYRTSVSSPLAKGAEVILIGSSTGGTVAIAELLKEFPEDFPPVVVCQHIPDSFVATFVKNLNELNGKRVLLANSSQEIAESTVYIIPGKAHGVLTKSSKLLLELKTAPAVNGHTPSVDVLFESAARLPQKAGFVALLLTGMGADGAKGLLELRRAGAKTICQDEKSSVVFGMPREGIELGAADYVLPLGRMAMALFGAAAGKQRHVAKAS